MIGIISVYICIFDKSEIDVENFGKENLLINVNLALIIHLVTNTQNRSNSIVCDDLNTQITPEVMFLHQNIYTCIIVVIGLQFISSLVLNLEDLTAISAFALNQTCGKFALNQCVICHKSEIMIFVAYRD